jgi:hypothetical protein
MRRWGDAKRNQMISRAGLDGWDGWDGMIGGHQITSISDPRNNLQALPKKAATRGREKNSARVFLSSFPPSLPPSPASPVPSRCHVSAPASAPASTPALLALFHPQGKEKASRRIPRREIGLPCLRLSFPRLSQLAKLSPCITTPIQPRISPSSNGLILPHRHGHRCPVESRDHLESREAYFFGRYGILQQSPQIGTQA